MSVPASTPDGIAQFNAFLPDSRFVPGNDHLGDAIAIIYRKILIGKIDQQYFDLPPVVGVNGSRGVQYRDPGFESQAAPGADLGFVSQGKLHEQAGWNYFTLQGFEGYLFFQKRARSEERRVGKGGRC